MLAGRMLAAAAGSALDLANLPDATILAHYRADNYAAGSWTDRSGNGYTLTQGTSGNRPTAVADGGADFNNKPVVRFDGGDDFVSRATTPAVSQPYTILTISKLTQNVATTQVLAGTQSANNPSIGVLDDERPRINAGAATISGPDSVLNAANLQEGYFNGASSALRVNNVQVTTGNVDTGGLTGFRIGNASFPWGGDVAEIVLISGALTAADREYLVRYVTQRYGFSL